MSGAFANLIEEPAYLAEYLLKGQIGTLANPENGSVITNGGGGEISPRTTDYRDLEGMGVALCAALIRDRSQIYNYAGVRTDVPVIAGDRVEKARDCYEIIAQGTDDILELREKLESVLQTKYGRADALPAMLQPLGWSHHIKCRFVDAGGEAISGIEACSICKTGGREYHLPWRGTPTGSDGNYTLDEFFPGESTLRIHQGADSTDLTDITIPWTRATNEEIDLGDICVEEDSNLLEELRGCGGMYGSLSAYMEVPGEEPAYVIFGLTICDYADNPCDSLQWSGTEGRYECTRISEDSSERQVSRDSVYARAAIDARSLEIPCMRSERITTFLADSSQYILITEIELVDVPVLYHPGDQWDSEDFLFSLDAAEVPSHVNRAYYRHGWTQFGVVETSTLLNSPSGADITFEHYSWQWVGAPGSPAGAESRGN
jgi:hypothetical protein